MNLENTLANLNTASEMVESSYKILEGVQTKSDIETIVKQNLLIRIKNNLTDLVIISDILDELNNNPDDELILESILELVNDSQEMLS